MSTSEKNCQIQQRIGIQASLALVKKSKDPFAPATEGIMNALDAIKQLQNVGTCFVPHITLSLFFAKHDLFEDRPHQLISISIEDNGIGFVDENARRLIALGDKSKKFNNRGTGKLQFFHRFRKLEISSIYTQDNNLTKQIIKYDINDNYSTEPCVVDSDSKTTCVLMNDFYGDQKEQEYWSSFLKEPLRLKKEIIRRLFLRLFMEKESRLEIRIKIIDDNSCIYDNKISDGSIPMPEKTEKANVSSVKLMRNKDNDCIEWESVQNFTLDIRRFKIPVSDVDNNEVYLCSKNILVQKFPFQILKKHANLDGYRYLTSISGDILDDPNNVNQSVDGFTFPKKKEIETDIEEGDCFYPDQNFIFIDDIKNSIKQTLIHVYSDIEDFKDEQQQSIKEIAQQFGITEEIVTSTSFDINDNEKEIAQKLFIAQAKIFASKSIEIQDTYNELVDIESKVQDPLSQDYGQKLLDATQKLLALIPSQNKDELARYIIRRDMIVKILRLILKENSLPQRVWSEREESGEQIRKDKEGLIHDLIFKRKQVNGGNDLWILNEEFVHFSGCSDLQLNQIAVNGVKLIKPEVDIQDALTKVGIKLENRLEHRPDIFLYPEEGKCILIEFKAPDVDMSLYLDQIPRYAKLLANYSSKKITHFYGYLIGEKINENDLPGRFNTVSYGNYWVNPSEPVKDITDGHPIANIYQEVITLSTIADRAELRNRSFAEKLGIKQK